MGLERVLLVEDNPGDARLIEEALAEEQPRRFDLVHVDRLDDGCTRAASEPFVAMLLDLSLPDSSGLDTVRRARAATAALPIIVLTGLGDESMAVAALAEGAQDYLVKGECDARVVARALRYAIERFRLERQLREAHRLEAVGQLAGGIAHHFNNALVTVLGYSDLLLADCSPGDARREPLQEIARGAREAADLASQLLAVGQRQRLAPRRIDLNAGLNDLAATLRDSAGPAIAIDLQCGITPPIVFDRSQFQHVVSKLTTWMVNAMPEGGRILFETATVGTDRSGDGLFGLLTVTDTISGCDEVPSSRVFEPFHDMQLLTAGGRKGLELPSIYGLMAQSGGRITVGPTESGGNRFQLYFPAAPLAQQGRG